MVKRRTVQNSTVCIQLKLNHYLIKVKQKKRNELNREKISEKMQKNWVIKYTMATNLHTYVCDSSRKIYNTTQLHAITFVCMDNVCKTREYKTERAVIIQKTKRTKRQRECTTAWHRLRQTNNKNCVCYKTVWCWNRIEWYFSLF